MGRYMRECKRSREAAVVEKTPQIGARVARTSAVQPAPEKKRKIGLGESEMTAPPLVRLEPRLLAAVPAGNSDLPVTSGDSTCDSGGSDHVLASCCSSNGSTQLAKGSTDFVDLEEENEEFLATSACNLEKRRETSPSSDDQAELGKLEPTAMPSESNFCRRSILEEKMPSEVELEEFFSAAEMKLHKQFMDKYNFDIMKDEPLEGRYEWVRITVKP